MTADVIVVGAGGGGPVVAKELAERGLEVTMLEAGPWLDPDRDFSRLEDDMNGVIDGRLRWGPSNRTAAPWMRRRDGVGFILQASGVGGTTLHYNAIAPRIYPGSMTAWPFPYAELVPWYERVEEFLPVVAVGDLALKDEIFSRGCEGIGLARSDSADCDAAFWRPCRNAILPAAAMTPGREPRYPESDGCTMCGHCIQGCAMPVGAPLERKAKRATNVSFVPAAVATGRCRVIPDAFVTTVLFEHRPDGRARARGVRWRDTAGGEMHEEEARAVVLAGGTVETPRLWLNSGLPNSHDVVGRYFTMHLQDFVTGFFDRDVSPDAGQVTMARADFPGTGTFWAQGVGPQAFAVAIAGIGRGFWDQTPAGEPWDIRGRFFGAEAMRRIAEYRRSLTICISTDDEEVPENRVALAEDWPADEHGAVPNVIYRPTPRTVERREWLSRTAANVLRTAGAHTVHRTDPAPFVTHLMGTMRIGNDPATSVCDPGGEAHEVEGLFVADCSALPNGCGGVNPTLT
ncbi:MAG: GMC family oxidoreductase N-terminal domain-containing protein, partial [Actinomycetota bacterium]